MDVALKPNLKLGRRRSYAAVALELQMSLNWDLTKIDDFDEISTKAESGITDALIYATLFCGLEKITASNAPEWNFRLSFYQKLYGELLQGASDACREAGETDPDHEHERTCYGPAALTWQHVERRIGLSTNAFPSLSRTKWLGKMGRDYASDVQRQTRREREKREGTVTL
jgi:hypothetical protein